jgi:arsenate reductase
MTAKKRVLILCTGNSCRSQMAEGVLRHYGGEQYEVHSAGLHATHVNALAVEVMKEIGIDISTHRSKSVREFDGQSFDCVITVCGNADKKCPYFAAPVRRHWPFDDPPHGQGVTPETLKAFRKVRDRIHKKFKAAAEKGIERA